MSYSGSYQQLDAHSPLGACNRRALAVSIASFFVGAVFGPLMHTQTSWLIGLTTFASVVDVSSSTCEFNYIPSMLPRPVPNACTGWEARCRAAGVKAQVAGLGKYWNTTLCDEESRGKFSCANRAQVWQSPSIYILPSKVANADQRVTDNLTSTALFLFLPGTGTPPQKVRTLLAAAADMGYYTLGLSYASQPVAVSMNDVWCTSRNGINASECNAQTHQSVLFGTPSGAAGGGLWDVKTDESVQHLLELSLMKLGWNQFLDRDASVRWELLIVSGHSQGASHAAYLSTQRPVRGAVLFSGPQECGPCAKDWLKVNSGDEPPLRRAVYEVDEECGDDPEEGLEQASFCAERHPQTLRNNLRAMGLTPGYLGIRESGYLVVDFDPLVSEGRNQHNSLALAEAAPPAMTALWKALVANM